MRRKWQRDRPDRIIADRIGPGEFRRAVFMEQAPEAAGRAFLVALPGLVEGLDEIVIERVRLALDQELAQVTRLVDHRRERASSRPRPALGQPVSPIMIAPAGKSVAHLRDDHFKMRDRLRDRRSGSSSQ